MWPSLQPRPHLYLGHLVGNISKIWPFLSVWWVHLLLEPYPLSPTPNASKGRSFQPVVWSNIIPPSVPFSWSPNPMHKSHSLCLRALCPLPCRASSPEYGKWQLSLHPLLPCSFCFNFLCILAIPSAVYEQHQERLTARKNHAEGTSQRTAIRTGGM